MTLVFRVVTPYGLENTNVLNPEDEGSMFLRKVGIYL